MIPARALRGRITLPQIREFPAQPVLLRRADLTMAGVDAEGPGILSGVVADCAARGIAETGPGFFRYDVIDMEGIMRMSFGVQVAPGTSGAPDLEADVLPAGRYVTLEHRGHPDELYDVTVMLMSWARARGHVWDMTEGPGGEHFAARMEFYHNGPGDPPDDWLTEIRIRLRD